MTNIVLATLGSLGDLHPFISIALRLKERGYDAVLAASPDFRDNVTGEGLAFHPVGPTRSEVLSDLGIGLDELGRRMIQDTIFALEAGCFPYLRRMYDDLLPAIERSSLVLTSTLMYSARLAAEKLNIPQMTVALQPMVFLSAYDPPAVSPVPWLASVLSKLGPGVTRVVYGAGRKSVIPRGRPLYEFRRTLGLPDTKANPLFEGQFSSLGTLALYSRCLGAIQPDFPPNTTITGFTFYDRVAHQRPTLAPELEAFLSSGAPPLVFTLGSIAVEFPGDFYRVSAQVARRLNRRAVLLVGRESMEAYRSERSPDVFVGDYAPFSELFPRAAAVVHHGGVGTLGQTLRAGKPQLVVPLFSDQFDNAARVVRLGGARSIGLKRYVPARVAAELTRLLDEPNYAARAADVGKEVGREDGADAAARIIDDFLRVPATRVAV
jgi:rhamnosyltransferase subunit B